MAQQTTVTLTDDLDGGKAAETVTFGLDGRVYEIDLSKKNAAALRKALGEFTASARRVRAGRPAAVKTARTESARSMPRRSGNGHRPTASRSPPAAASPPTSSRSTSPPPAERADSTDKSGLTPPPPAERRGTLLDRQRNSLIRRVQSCLAATASSYRAILPGTPTVVAAGGCLSDLSAQFRRFRRRRDR